MLIHPAIPRHGPGGPGAAAAGLIQRYPATLPQGKHGERTSTMKRALLATLAAALLAPAANAATAPSKAAAIVALKHKMTVYTGQKVWKLGPVQCVSPGGSGEIWQCTFRNARANIVFSNRTGGWASRVAVFCIPGGVTLGRGCR